jgi:phosphoglycolate phosphatase-like HAD superfamily hydrolase
MAAEPGPAPEGILFDIDGTLITTGGAGAVAWSRAVEELQGTPVDIPEVTESGMTDPEVGRSALEHVLDREPTQRELAQTMAKYLKHLPGAVEESDGYEVMPGVVALLKELVDTGCLVGLTTGNVEAAAHIKLARANLNRFFSFGGYGSDSNDRIELTRRALERARMVSGGSLDVSSCVGVGDTPRDVLAAHGAGISSLGVATGNYSVEQLRAAGVDHVVATLENGVPR